MTVQHATAVVNWFTRGWHRGPKVYVAPTARHLPFDVPEDVRGVHSNGEVHLVAAQPVDSLAQTLAHEAVGHFALRQMLGKEWPHFMRHLQDGMREGDPGFLSHWTHIRKVYVDESGAGFLSARGEADEVAAYVAEDMVCFRTGTIRPERPVAQALEAVAGRVIREGLGLNRSVSRSELEGALYLAVRHLEGWPWHPVRKRIRRGWRACCNIVGVGKYDQYKPPMSLAESEALLKAERDRLKAKAENEGFLSVGGGLIAFVLGVGICAALLIIGLLQAFGR